MKKSVGIQTHNWNLCVSQWLPESPRFDVLMGRTERAMRTLTRIAKDNGKTVPQGVLIAYEQVRRKVFYRAHRDEVRCLIADINKKNDVYFSYFTESPWTDQRSLHCSVLEDNSSSVVYMVSSSDAALVFGHFYHFALQDLCASLALE